MTRNSKFQILNSKKTHGVISLGATILLGGIMVEIGIAVALLSFFVNQGTAGGRLSAAALAAAGAGVDDAVLRIIRNEYPSVSYAVSYASQFSSAYSTVTICKGGDIGCAFSDPRKFDIISIGQSGSQPPFRKRKLNAVLEVDPAIWLIRVEKVTEVQL